MPSDTLLKALNRAHRIVLTLSAGRIGWTVSDMEVLELTTVGRRSARPRAVMLTSPLRDGRAVVVVASRGGDPTHPAWFLNLRENPDVEVVLKGAARTPMRARVATAADRARLWPKITAAHRNYAGYQARTDREIPLVLLEPRD